MALALVLTLVAPAGAAEDRTRGQLLDPWPDWSIFDTPADRLDPRSGLLDAVGQRLDLGLLDLGMRVAPRRPSLALGMTGESASLLGSHAALADSDVSTTDIGLDLRLRWPSTSGAADSMPLQPYLSLGPAVAVPYGEEALAATRASRVDPAPAFGLRGALGLTWQFAHDASMFGEYRLTRDRPFGARSSSDVGVDLFYGFSLRW